MEDLNSTISAILGDPQKMEQLRAVAQSLGLGPPDGAPAPAMQQPQSQPSGGGFDPGMLASLLQGFQGGGSPPPPQQQAPPQPQQPPSDQSQPAGAPGLTAALPSLIAMAQNFNKNDKNVDLLRALKPHFSASRAGRIDDAVRIMQLMRAWPSLRDSGLLGSLGNLFTGGGNR